jgi:hypothetical protein
MLASLGIAIRMVEVESPRVVLTAQPLHVVEDEDSKDAIGIGRWRLQTLRGGLFLRGRSGRSLTGSDTETQCHQGNHGSHRRTSMQDGAPS